MAVREVVELDETTWVLRVQHPALRLGVHRLSPGWERTLPTGGGCYVLVALPLQLAYAGTSEDLPSRVPTSRARNLPKATHVITVAPLGVAWGEAQRYGVEARLIRSLGAPTNRAAGRVVLGDSPYLDAVADEVMALVGLLCPGRGDGLALPTQGAAARELVLAQHRHPYTVGELVTALQDLGWTAGGATTYRTLRRDLCDPGRGGRTDIRAHGPWSEPGSRVYLAGRTYASGWRAHRARPATGPVPDRGGGNR